MEIDFLFSEKVIKNDVDDHGEMETVLVFVVLVL
jgi:hypothetical protein